MTDLCARVDKVTGLKCALPRGHDGGHAYALPSRTFSVSLTTTVAGNARLPVGLEVRIIAKAIAWRLLAHNEGSHWHAAIRALATDLGLMPAVEHQMRMLTGVCEGERT